jgi:hypothetical protein
MAAIYEEIVLAWEGEQYTVRPDYRMVQRIEAAGISIFGVCQRMSRGEPQMSQVSEMIARMLQSGGAKRVTPERVYAHLLTQADEKEFQRIAMALMTAFIPRERDSGNSEGPEDGAGPRGKRRRPRPK